MTGVIPRTYMPPEVGGVYEPSNVGIERPLNVGFNSADTESVDDLTLPDNAVETPI